MSDIFSRKELKELLLKAKAADRELAQFGASKHKYQWNPPAVLSDVEAFEREIGIRLPEEYRNFLLQVGNGGAGPYYGLFPLQEIPRWLCWDVAPQKEPLMYPGMTLPDDEEESEEEIEVECEEAIPEEEEFFRGSIPIGSQGDSYFVHLMVTGPNKGRVVYVETGGSYVFFPREQGFLAWYTRWLREVANGYHIFWYGTNLDGTEEELRQYYAEASNEADKRLVLSSMEKFPSLSTESAAWIEQIAPDFVLEPDARWLLKLLHRIAPAKKDSFMEKRWEAGMYDGTITEIYYSIHCLEEREEKVLGYWWKRILDCLPQISQKHWYIAFELLTKCPQVRLRDVIGFWEITERKNKLELIHTFGRFPDAKEHMKFFMELLEEREDLELLNSVLVAVPIVKSQELLGSVSRIIEEVTAAIDALSANSDQTEECLLWKSDAHRVCNTADIVLERVKEKFMNPKIPGIPHPHRILLQVGDRYGLGIGKKHGKGSIAIHPFVALVISENLGFLPTTAEEWNRVLMEMKTLILRPERRYIRSGSDWLYVVPPETHSSLPESYYYDLTDWSVIGRMENLRLLTIEEICVDDFSFLAQCKKVEKLSLRNTNFSDCRLLREMPNLKKVNLQQCQLEHNDILENMHLKTF